MILLYLDDIRSPITDPWVRKMMRQGYEITQAWSYDDFVLSVELDKMPDLISFDFDLGEDSRGFVLPNGGTCVRWIIEYCHANNVPLPEYRLHTANPEGRKEMHSLLQSALKSGHVLSKKKND